MLMIVIVGVIGIGGAVATLFQRRTMAQKTIQLQGSYPFNVIVVDDGSPTGKFDTQTEALDAGMFDDEWANRR